MSAEHKKLEYRKELLDLRSIQANLQLGKIQQMQQAAKIRGEEMYSPEILALIARLESTSAKLRIDFLRWQADAMEHELGFGGNAYSDTPSGFSDVAVPDCLPEDF